MDGGGALIVADTNLIVALACKTEQSAMALAVMAHDKEWVAPPIWQSELRNALLGMMREGKIGINTALAASAFAAENVDTYEVATGAVLRLAETHSLTAYDAEFAVLSEWLGCKTVGFDEHLLKPGLAVHPDKFLKHPPGQRAA